MKPYGGISGRSFLKKVPLLISSVIYMIFLCDFLWAMEFTNRSSQLRPKPVIILLDRSFSMQDPLNGQRKFVIAKAAFGDLAQQLKGQTNVSVRFFAGGKNELNEAANCLATELAVPFGTVIKPGVMEKLIGGIKPLGRKTNIAYAMNQALEDLKPFSSGQIIIISDGQENCQQDPISLAQALSEQNITVNTIGIGMPGQFAQLGRIALAAEGEFQLADSSESLAAALASLLPVAVPGQSITLGTESRSIAEMNGNRADPSVNKSPASPAPPIEPLELEFIEVHETPDKPIAIELILDVSGSMAGKIGAKTKMDLARQALDEALLGLDNPAFTVGFRAYGFDNSVAKTVQTSCPNTKLLKPFTTGQIKAIQQQAKQLSPFGYTPIAKSLELAGQDLNDIEYHKAMIILISDGEETCGGDPVKVAETLRAQGIDVELHVVGFDLEKTSATQMQAVAEAGGGEYYDAGDAEALTSSLVSIVEVAKDKIDPSWMRTIHPMAGGGTPQEAVKLTPGTYTLSRFLEKGEEMFFRVATQSAQHGVVRGLIQSHRLIRKDGDMLESGIAYAQYRISIYAMDGKKFKGRFVRLEGEPGTYGHVGYSDKLGEGFIFSIGSAYDRVHKDALFNVEIVEAGDIYQGFDAPGKRNDDLPDVSLNTTIIGHLGDGDERDIYRLSVDKKKALGIQLKFTDKAFRYRLYIRGLDVNKRLAMFHSEAGEISEIIEIPDTERQGVSIEIRSSNPSLKTRFSSYELVLSETGNE